MNEPEPAPPKYPPWVKKEILLPIFGVVLLGLVAGNYIVYRAIKKERRYSPSEFGPMDHRPSPTPVRTNASGSTNPPAR